MKTGILITICLFHLVFALQAQDSRRNYTDHKPVYEKWKDSYILDKIEYRPNATIFYFRFICDNQNSGGAIFYPPQEKDAWYLKARGMKRNFPLVAVKNIRRDGILIKQEITDEVYDSPPSADVGYTIFSCEVHFGALDNTVKVADLIEGAGQEANARHFNCFKIKLKTWDDETLGSEEDSHKTIAKFERKTGKSTQQEPKIVAPSPKYEGSKKHLLDASDLVCSEVVILNGIQFHDNSTEYKGIIEARKNINILATYLKANPTAHLTLYGHTDIFGDKERNMDLSKARVIKIQRWLSMNGIHPRRIDCKWFGSEQPLKPEGGAINRRVEARLDCKN